MRIFKPRSNLFDMTHQHYTTLDMGDFAPFDCIEVLPGDTWKLEPHALCHFEALQAPTMMDCKMIVNYFYVPNRLIWDDWDDFITRGKDGLSEPVLPYLEDYVVTNGSLADHFGLPKKLPNATNNVVLPKVSVLPFRAYNKIINDWVIHSEVESERVFSTASGKDTTTDLTMFTKGWSPDRFTRCLPTSQLGPDVLLPLGDSAPVTIYPDDENGVLKIGTSEATAGGVGINSVTEGGQRTLLTPSTTTSGTVKYTNLVGETDLSSSSARTSMREWRVADAIQKFLELNSRVGNRIVENLLGHWGVRSDDLRLQRSEYLGGAVSNVVTSEVVQTSSSTDSSAQGNLAGHAWSSNYCKMTRRFKEHGWIIGIVSVMPKAVYSQGVEKKWLRESVYDYPDPLLAHLSEQPVFEEELVAGTATPKKVFGFLPIFEECRHIESRATGNFTGNQAFWVSQRIFTDPNDPDEPKAPALNANFLRGKPSKDIFAVTDDDPNFATLQIAINVKATAVRKLPKEGTPL